MIAARPALQPRPALFGLGHAFRLGVRLSSAQPVGLFQLRNPYPLRLSTGSNVAVARIPAAGPGPALKTPLVFLHGGPGAYVRDTDLEMLRAIAAQGVEVVTFDQAGAGLSDRLGVREYSLARAVADLEALREELGSDRLSIMGQSWGSMLAFEYAVAHPGRVDSLVLTSGGLLSQRAQKFELERTAAAELGQPKFPVYFMATALLHGVNPDAAVAFTPREELDATWRKAAAGNIARWYCKEDAASVPSEDAFGKMPAFDAYQTLALKSAMTGRAEPPAPPSVLPRTLILRGACDFVPWIAARDLRDRLEATLISIPGVGHAIWPKEADLVVKLTVDHLKGSSFEKMAYRGDDDPAATASTR